MLECMQNENASWSGCVWNWQHSPGTGTLAESRRLLRWSALGEDRRGSQTAGRGNEHLLLHKSDWRCLAAPGRRFGLHQYPSTTNSANCCEGSRYLFIFGVGPKIIARWQIEIWSCYPSTIRLHQRAKAALKVLCGIGSAVCKKGHLEFFVKILFIIAYSFANLEPIGLKYPMSSSDWTYGEEVLIKISCFRDDEGVKCFYAHLKKQNNKTQTT